SAGAQYNYSVTAIDRAGNVSPAASGSVNTCLFLQPPGTTAGPDGTNSTFVVDALCGAWTASVDPTNAWIQVLGPTSGSGSAQISYSVQPNPDVTDRSGSILVKNKTYAVMQKGRKCTAAITTGSSPIGGGGTSGGGTFNCGTAVTVNASPYSGYNFV